jgi:hypothetical protein
MGRLWASTVISLTIHEHGWPTRAAPDFRVGHVPGVRYRPTPRGVSLALRWFLDMVRTTTFGRARFRERNRPADRHADRLQRSTDLRGVKTDILGVVPAVTLDEPGLRAGAASVRDRFEIST